MTNYVDGSPYWVNAVVTLRIPLDVTIDAADSDKLDAAVRAAETLGLVDLADGAEVTYEVVIDGEPV